MKAIVTIITCLGLFVAEAQAVLLCRSACPVVSEQGQDELPKKLSQDIMEAIRRDNYKETDDNNQQHTMVNRTYQVESVGSDFSKQKVPLQGNDKIALGNFVKRQLKLARKWNFAWRRPEIAAAIEIRQIFRCLKDTTCTRFKDAVDNRINFLKGEIQQNSKYRPYTRIQNDPFVSELMVLLALLAEAGISDEWIQ